MKFFSIEWRQHSEHLEACLTSPGVNLRTVALSGTFARTGKAGTVDHLELLELGPWVGNRYKDLIYLDIKIIKESIWVPWVEGRQCGPCIWQLHGLPWGTFRITKPFYHLALSRLTQVCCSFLFLNPRGQAECRFMGAAQGTCDTMLADTWLRECQAASNAERMSASLLDAARFELGYPKVKKLQSFQPMHIGWKILCWFFWAAQTKGTWSYQPPCNSWDISGATALCWAFGQAFQTWVYFSACRCLPAVPSNKKVWFYSWSAATV